MNFCCASSTAKATVRTAAEGALTSIVTTTSLDDMLTTGRKLVEARVKRELQARLDRYAAGVEVLHVQLLDVHPSLEVVDAFREVSGAYEEKNRMINEAEGYRNEQIALARGNAKAADRGRRRLLARQEEPLRRRCEPVPGARIRHIAASPGLTETRLYLETMEQVLPGKRKMIIDSSNGRRHLILLEDGVEIAPPGAALLAPKGPIE